MAFKDKIVETIGTVSGATSALGGYQFCHNVCLSIIALLSAIGITIAGMPLMFLTKVAVPFWIIGTLFLTLMSILTYANAVKFSSKLMIINTGLLIIGIPFKTLQSFQTLFWIVGGLLIVGTVVFALLDF